MAVGRHKSDRLDNYKHTLQGLQIYILQCKLPFNKDKHELYLQTMLETNLNHF